MNALERLHSLLDQGYLVSTSTILDAYPFVHGGRTVTRGAVTQRMRTRRQRPVSRTSEALWAPTSVRLAYPEFQRVDYVGAEAN